MPAKTRPSIVAERPRRTRDAFENCLAGNLGDVADLAAFLHRTIGKARLAEADRAAAVADRVDRVLQAGIAAAGFDHGVGGDLRGLRGGRCDQRKRRNAARQRGVEGCDWDDPGHAVPIEAIG
jgi:hypothetical protein